MLPPPVAIKRQRDNELPTLRVDLLPNSQIKAVVCALSRTFIASLTGQSQHPALF